jgi:hypothetical protein
MALIDADFLYATFGIATSIGEARLNFAIGNASRMLKGWVGSDAYADASDESPEDADRADALKSAETYLAMYHALLDTSVRIRTNGIVHRESDAAGNLGGNVINEFYSPGDLIKLRAEYLAQAETIAVTYRSDDVRAATANTLTLQGGWRSCSEVEV